MHIDAAVTADERERLLAYVQGLNNIGGLKFERADLYALILKAVMNSDEATGIIREAIKQAAREAI